MTPEQKRKFLKELRRLGLRPGMTARAEGMRLLPETFDREKRSARFIATTEKPAVVWDWDRWDFVEEVLRMDGLELPATSQVPLLDTHSRHTVQNVLGSAADFQDCEVDGMAGKDCETSFSKVKEGQDAATKVEEGHITDVSVGYEVLESYYVPDGEKQVIKGKEYEGPVKVSTRWKLKELSLVPIGADSLAKVRAEHIQNEEVVSVNEKLRKYLESRGLAIAATETEAVAFMDSLIKKSADDRLEVERLQADDPPASGQRSAGGQGAATGPDVEQAVAAGIQAERARVNQINDAVAVAGLPATFARGLVDQGIGVDKARALVFDELKKNGPPVGAGAGRSIEVGVEGREKFRAAATDGLLMRGGIRLKKPADGHGDFRGCTLMDVARMSLESVGENTRGMSRKELAGRALSPASASDFPALMSNLAGRHLLAAYQAAPQTWRPIVSVVSANDFKDIYGVKMSDAPELLDLGENGEFKTATFSDSQEKYRIITKGRKAFLTRQMLINDDLRGFTRIPTLFGNSVRRMESDAVYSLITGNPVMSDGKTLFHAAHKNIEITAALKRTVDSGSLSSGRTIMKAQKAENGSRLDIQPAFLLVPNAQETDSEILLRSTALPDVNMSSGVHNPWAGKLSPISEGRLDDDSTVAWYLIADPNHVPCIEVAYLEGEEQPYIEEEVKFGSGSVEIACRHDFGAGIMDYAGVFKNDGE